MVLKEGNHEAGGKAQILEGRTVRGVVELGKPIGVVNFGSWGKLSNVLLGMAAFLAAVDGLHLSAPSKAENCLASQKHDRRENVTVQAEGRK